MTIASQKMTTNKYDCLYLPIFLTKKKLELLFYVFKSLPPFMLSVQNKEGQLKTVCNQQSGNLTKFQHSHDQLNVLGIIATFNVCKWV